MISYSHEDRLNTESMSVDDGSFPRITWSESFITSTAAEQGPRLPLIAIVRRSLFREILLRYRRRIEFRTTHNTTASVAYSKMTIDEFNDINLRQAWANWRTIPRNLNGRLPFHSLQAIDLCCGTGDSLSVLAYYLPVNSQLTGLELTKRFVVAARRRTYRNLSGRLVRPQFHCQSVLDGFRDSAGRRFTNRSIDLVNASGALGCHFQASELRSLAMECARVLRRGALALIDSGYDGINRCKMAQLFESVGFRTVGSAKSCLWDRRTQLCLERR